MHVLGFWGFGARAIESETKAQRRQPVSAFMPAAKESLGISCYHDFV